MTAKLSFLGAMSLLIAACAPDGSAPAPAAMTLARFLDLNSEARGGKAAIENIRAVEIELEIVEPAFEVTGRYVATRDGFMRIDILAGGERVFTEALGPDGAWQMTGDGTVSRQSVEGEAALRRGIFNNLYGLHELAALGYQLTLVGEAQRNGGAFWEIEKIGPDGFSEHLFFDKDTYLLASHMQTSALHPDVDMTQTRQETFHTDYRAAGGVLFSDSGETRNLDTGETMQTTKVTSRALNPVIDPAMFLTPPAQ